jgi:acetylornithine deacetylase/succinyl-diaminopimelate desuccinylase-like protein
MAIERIEDIKDTKDRQLVVLLQELIRTPSWIPDNPTERLTQNENQVVDLVENWIKANTAFDVQRQPLAEGRFNLIASKGKPDLVFLAHTDTVGPNPNAPYDQLAAEIHDGKIWGRGSTDMKSGIATMLQAMSLAPDANNVWAFFYADEEYDFLGMKGLVQEYPDLKPKLIVSSDGADLKIGHGCRGLIEFRVRVTGETGHPAKGTGKSAILRGFKGIFEFENYLTKFPQLDMGGTTLNINPVLGGQRKGDSLDSEGHLDFTKIGLAANVVPDVMEFKVDIRPGNPDLKAVDAIQKLQQSIENQGLKFELIEKVHDYGAWYTDLSDIREFAEIARKLTGSSTLQVENPGESGYLDLQMFWDVVGRPPSFMFGGGNGDTSHTPEEHIEIGDLIKERDFFKEVLKRQIK